MHAWLTTLLILAAPTKRGSAEKCPRLFGTKLQRAANSDARAKRLHALTARKFAIDVLYSGNWREPKPLSFANVRVVQATTGDALVEISAELAASAGCRARRYRLEVDDTLGSDHNIVGIIDGIVLLERRGELHYLEVPDRDAPVFSMTWRATWRMPHPRSPPVAGSPMPRQPAPVRR